MIASLNNLSLRWRLIFAFLAVSVIPVLMASYIAANEIEEVFQRNIENWLSETARFLSGETKESSDEAEKAAAIMAAALDTSVGSGPISPGVVEPLGKLLISTGYDLVRVLDSTGNTLFSVGDVQLRDQPPLRNGSSISIAHLENKDRLVIGAVRAFGDAGQPRFVFVANLVDRSLFGVTRNLSSVSLHVYRMAGRNPARIVDDNVALQHNEIPRSVVAALIAGAPSAVYTATSHAVIMAYAPLRGADGRLLGVIACGLSATSDLFEQLGRWTLFLVLAGLAGAISFLVALLVAGRIARPVRNLTTGVMNVAEGSYDAHVPEEGGRELADLAHGFNLMVERLRRLNAMEVEMRRQQQLAGLGEAAAVIAHEIRNPLGIIRTSTEVVRLKSHLGPEEDRLLSFVLDEVRRIDRLVADILDYARPSHRTREKVDLHDIVGRAGEALAITMSEKNVGLDRIGGDVPLIVEGDRDQLYQVILNLLLNAVDAMPEGGRIAISGETKAGMLHLSIADTGSGIEPEAIERIFDPFFTTKARGTGLGLAKVQAIMANHGGTVSVTSSPMGTTFLLSFSEFSPTGASHAA
jgi:signal transduction histidine kinase